MCLRACMLSRFSRVRLFVTSWTVARQAPLSMRFSRQEFWGGLPGPPPGIFLTQGLNSHLLNFLHWQVGSLPLVPPGKPSISVYWGLNFLRAKLVEPSSSHGLPWSSQGFTTQLPNDSEVPGTMLIKQNHMNIIK